MGVNAWVVCRDCGARAPEVGDFGYIGYPSLESRSEPVEGIHTFGYLYEGFKALRLLTGELEAVRAFLRRHRRHQTDLVLEGDDDADVESDADQPDERDAEPDGPRLDDGFYVLGCACGASCRSTGAVRLRPFSPFRLTARQAALFRERVVEADDEDVYRVVDEILEPAKDPRRFDAFLRDHLLHGVTARLDTEDAWSVLPAGRERGEASEATFALQGAELPSRLQPRLTLSPPLRLAWSFDESPLPFPTPFEDCVLALGYDEATFCVNHDGSLRWQLPMHCRFPLADEAGRMVMFAERKIEDRWVLRAITIDRDAGTILGDAVASHTPVLGLPGRSSYIGREHQVVTSTGPTRTALALVALADEPRVLWEIVEARDEFGSVGIGLPCTSGGRVFVERGPRFVCLELEDAREVWAVDLTPFGGPAGELHRLGPCRVGGLVIAPVRKRRTRCLRRRFREPGLAAGGWTASVLGGL